jgi:hypothetical protein
MSILEFSNAMKNRFKTHPYAVFKELNALERAIGTSYDPTSKTLLNSTSLRIVDQSYTSKVTGKTYQTSAFRAQGESAENTVFVVTERNLQMQFNTLGISPPKIGTITIIPGSPTVLDSSGEIISGGLLTAYIYWLTKVNKSKRTIEYYTDTSKVNSPTEGTVTAIREFKRPHSSTNTVMYNFLKYCGLPITRKQYVKQFQIGHIESQSHGRASITLDRSDEYILKDGFFSKLIDLNQKLDIASSSLLPQYSAVTAAIFKDFKGDVIKMNVEMQPTGNRLAGYDPLTNQGSGALSQALAFSSIIGKLFTVEDETNPKIKRVIRDNDLITEKLAELYNNFIENKATIELALANFQNLPPNYLVDLESSDTIRAFLAKHIISILTSKPAEKVKIKHGKVPIFNIDNNKSKTLINEIKQLSKSIKASIEVLRADNKKALTETKAKSIKTPPVQFLSTVDQSTSLVSLQNILNQGLASQIEKNMGKGDRRDILNYRTGRFAESAKVETMSQSREGMITAFYSYMRNPYATFSFGGAQSSPATRDPKLLISRSIREIGATMVGNRMRAVLV